MNELVTETPQCNINITDTATEMNERLRSWMQEGGISQAALAEAMGYTRFYVNRVLNGHVEISDSFKWRFVEVYGFEALVAIGANWTVEIAS